MISDMLTQLLLAAVATATVVAGDNAIQRHINYVADPLERLMQSVRAQEAANPGLFETEDLQEFLGNQGPLAALRFLNQRSGNSRRASRLAYNMLKWRKELQLSHVGAGSFPCDLFNMGLIFESGRAHSQLPTGEFVETSPVIWIRLGALGSIVKQLERATPERLVSFGLNTPRRAWHKVRNAVSARRERRYKPTARQARTALAAERGAPVRDLSVKENQTIRHVLRAIAWWIEDWARRHPQDARATLVLDFENTDFAFASWSVGEFLVKLDDLFPDLFDRIIGFRYRAKLWSLHTPISMFNRIFKSRFASSPETDRKLRFVDKAAQISAYMPRVDESGLTMLPKHVSGVCMPPDSSKAPPGCRPLAGESTDGLFDQNLWRAIYNEFYQQCTPVERA